MDKSRVDYSRYRIKKAREDLQASMFMLTSGNMNASANRSYYAIFHALRAVLILDNFESKKHSGIISRFIHNYVKAGIFEVKFSDMIRAAFRVREYADYGDFYDVTHEQAQKQLHNAETIIASIEKYVFTRWSHYDTDAIFTRVSTRKFEPRKVDSKYIIKLIRAAMAAPSAANQQPWEFYVTEDREIISRLSQVTPYATPAANAPVVIVPCCNLDVLKVPEMADIDMAIACENILLEAEELGLGAVMLGIAPFEDRVQAVNEILHLPENFRAFMIIPVGYPVNKHAQEDRYEPSRVHVI